MSLIPVGVALRLSTRSWKLSCLWLSLCKFYVLPRTCNGVCRNTWEERECGVWEACIYSRWRSSLTLIFSCRWVFMNESIGSKMIIWEKLLNDTTVSAFPSEVPWIWKHSARKWSSLWPQSLCTNSSQGYTVSITSRWIQYVGLKIFKGFCPVSALLHPLPSLSPLNFRSRVILSAVTALPHLSGGGGP